MLSKYHQSLQNQLDYLKRSVARPNVLILGKCGAGKSTLANLVFGRNIFLTGAGRPVTKSISYFNSQERGIGIFDSQGYEFGAEAENSFFHEVVGFATKFCKVDDAEAVHLCWYCIPASQERVQSIDVRTISEIRALGIPTAIILTKSDLISIESLARLLKVLQQKLPPHSPVFRTAKVRTTDDIHALCEWSKQSLPKSLQMAFTRAQGVELEIKTQTARQIVDRTMAHAGTLGLNPHDPAKTEEIIQCCISMTADILYIYEMEEIKSSLGGMAGIIEGSNKLVSLLAYLLEGFAEAVGHVMGEAPGRLLGQIVGRLLSSATQSKASQKIVWAVGGAVIEVCSSLGEGALRSSEGQEINPRLLQEQFEKNIQKRLEG